MREREREREREEQTVEVEKEEVELRRGGLFFLRPNCRPRSAATLLSLSRANCVLASSPSSLSPLSSYSPHLRGQALDDITRALQNGGEASLFLFVENARERRKKKKRGREEEGENVSERGEEPML